VVFGFYMLYYSVLLWVFPFDGGVIQTDIALAASVILFFIAPAICLYKPQTAPVIGLLCLAAISPFGIHWLQYKVLDQYFLLWKVENILLCIAVILYLVAVFVSINIFTVRKSLKAADINKRTRLVLALVPFIVFAALIIYFVAQ
jgi:uncharacterized membrane protein SirB2